MHVIGLREPPHAVRTFKIERIRTIRLLPDQPYTIPDAFDAREMLQDAWGIWYTEAPPVEVVLHFSRQVAPRVAETQWHHAQALTEQPDGSLIWRAPVAEWREMLPWIRGWGAEVEVLEPEALRETVKAHLQRLASNYNLTRQARNSTGRLLQLWGKTTQDPHVFHPALYHMLDVGHVAQQLLSARAAPRWRRVLAHTLGADAGTLHEWLPWIIALHDIGKLAVPFQAQNEAQRQRLLANQFELGQLTAEHRKLHHTLVGRLVIKEWARQFPMTWRTVFLDMVSGHHGIYQRPEGAHRRLWATLMEPEEWPSLRMHGVGLLASFLLLDEPSVWPEPPNISAAIAALNGFTILCDWLGSDEAYFPPQPNLPLMEYIPRSRRQARARAEEAGFFPPSASRAPASFQPLFGWPPRPLQTAVDQIPAHLLTEPTLTIIEAPTGEGKTEAALTLARRIAQAQGTDEMYVALPTTATSNAMYQRLQEHLQVRLQLPPELIRLVHGQAFLVEDDLRLAPTLNGQDTPHPALTWFAPKKRALLSPFGVGTVDQAELAALNVRHNALRLIGLAGKVVILDEVHAYDTYMTTIIERMLHWLAALGSSVILLSATLPTARRQSLAAAYTGNTLKPPAAQAYPYVLTVSATDYHASMPQSQQNNRAIHLHTLHFAETDWDAKARWLAAQVQKGGCICWITNTVERAQRIFEKVLELVAEDVDCMLLHARFPLASRQAIEKEILTKFGKTQNGRRPRKSIVVGTQVLEQSLDIDFDLMVSDLAPIDLLLQRIGRLHRHERTARSPAHAEPHIYINCALSPDGQLLMGADRFYTPYILHKTWQLIAQVAAESSMLQLPRDYRPFIETVYADDPPPKETALWEAWQERRRQNQKYEDEALLRLANAPDPRRPFWQGARHTFREDEDSADWIVAQTRYQERESVTVILLERVDAHTAYLPTGAEPIPLDRPAGRELQLRLLQHSVRLSHPGLVQALKKADRPKLFTESALLKQCYPLWVTERRASIDGVQVELDHRLGVCITKEGV